MRQYHVKDRRRAATGDMADLGTGVVDFAGDLPQRTRCEEYIVENDTPDVNR